MLSQLIEKESKLKILNKVTYNEMKPEMKVSKRIHTSNTESLTMKEVV